MEFPNDQSVVVDVAKLSPYRRTPPGCFYQESNSALTPTGFFLAGLALQLFIQTPRTQEYGSKSDKSKVIYQPQAQERNTSLVLETCKEVVFRKTVYPINNNTQSTVTKPCREDREGVRRTSGGGPQFSPLAPYKRIYIYMYVYVWK